MGRAAAHEADERGDDAAHRRDLAALRVARRRQGIVVTEQLVGAVDQMDVQNYLRGTPPSLLAATQVFLSVSQRTMTVLDPLRPRCGTAAKS